jgi:hypothetical protein
MTLFSGSDGKLCNNNMEDNIKMTCESLNWNHEVGEAQKLVIYLLRVVEEDLGTKRIWFLSPKEGRNQD